MERKSIELKKQVVSEIIEKIKKAKSIALVDYKGMTVAEDTELRSNMRKANVEYKVIKNRLVLRALNECGYEGFDKDLEGATAVAFSYDDPMAALKIIVENSAKINKTAIKKGVVEGKILEADAMKAVANIPAKPVLIGQLLGLLTNPMRSLAVAISEVAKKSA